MDDLSGARWLSNTDLPIVYFNEELQHRASWQVVAFRCLLASLRATQVSADL